MTSPLTQVGNCTVFVIDRFTAGVQVNLAQCNCCNVTYLQSNLSQRKMGLTMQNDLNLIAVVPESALQQGCLG